MFLESRTKYTIWILLFFLLFNTPNNLFSQSFADKSIEYKVKVGYLYNFLQFIYWPRDTFKDSRKPLILAIFGKNPFGYIIEQIEDQTARGRKIKVLYITEISEKLKDCHIIFIPKKEQKNFPEILKIINKLPIVTIGEDEEFNKSEAMISLIKLDRKIVFEINLKKALQNNIKISSKLLKLARITE
ncbi:MAG: YfiR family protein [Verrucomicrobiota bacterium]|nr:YfiR family protein [Verrucomicrobiota bacterium]